MLILLLETIAKFIDLEIMLSRFPIHKQSTAVSMKLFLLIPLVFLISYSSSLYAQKLQVVTESFPPFVVVNGSDISGIMTQKVKEILNHGKLTYSINSYPWARSFQIARHQPNTLIYSIIKSPERIPYFHWFCPIYQSSAVFAFKLSDNPIDISSIASLKQAIVGTTRHGINHEHLQKHGFDIKKNLDISATENINLKKFVNGRVDAVLQSTESINYRLTKLGFEDISITQGVAINKSKPTIHCMALNKNSDQKLKQKIAQAFNHFKSTQSK